MARTGRPKALANVPHQTIVRALMESGGNLSAAASFLQRNNIKVCRRTLSTHVHEHEDLRAALAEVREISADFIEGTLFARAKSGDTHAMRIWLAVNARDRGHGKQSEAAIPLTPEAPAPSVELAEWAREAPLDEVRMLHTLLGRALGKKSVFDDDFVAQGRLNPHPKSAPLVALPPPLGHDSNQ